MAWSSCFGSFRNKRVRGLLVFIFLYWSLMTGLLVLDYIILGIWGLILGSFGSVVLTRCDHGFSWQIIRSILVGRSICPHCGSILGPLNLIPLVSWFVQRGKCTFCSALIPSFYPLCEIVALGGSLLYGYRGYMLGLGWGTLLLAAIGAFLFLLAYWDLKTGYLHDSMWFMTICLWLLFFFLFPVVGGTMQGFLFVLFLICFMIILYGLAGFYAGWKKTGRRGVWKEGLGEGDLWFILAFAPLVGILPLTYHPFLLLSIWLFVSGCVGLVQLAILSWYTDHQDEIIHFFPAMLTAFLCLFFL
ncbi:MAG: prepilin peptidase [Candidatus Absconditabacterales bacterium]|nr:prepilin peptidase [Candidatus Absconditabacterales bacterium]